ncbi:MAG TPA: ABC transporter permease [Kofleriaceae bacterium]
MKGCGILLYYIELAFVSFRRNTLLTVLMVLAISLGISASMTTLTVFHVLSGDPLPDKSSRLFYVLLDPQGMEGYHPGAEPPGQLTRADAEALYRAKRADRQAIMSAGDLSVQPQGSGEASFEVDARYTTPEFFAMFDVPFRYGGGWDDKAEAEAQRVAVIGKTLNDRLFGGASSIGREIHLDGMAFRVIGVLDHWRPAPKFYDLYVGKRSFTESEEVFIPFHTALDRKLKSAGLTNCFRPKPPGAGDHDLASPCVWVQMWAELGSADQAATYRAYLERYSDEQRANGRYARPNNVRMRSLREYLEFNKVIPRDVRLQVWVAFGFLLICLVNTVSLLLAKFLRRAPEIATRRAIGASQRSIFLQHLVEAGMLGLIGGVIGLALTHLGLWAIRQQPVDYAPLVHLDRVMFATTFVLAIVTSVLAGTIPAWRVCKVSPAFQLKEQ